MDLCTGCPRVSHAPTVVSQQYEPKVYHRSARQDWETPPEIFEPLNKEFGFTLDVCATPANAKCARYYTIEDDGLLQPWYGVCWMNPPYGRGIMAWIQKAYESALSGATVVGLVKATPDTRWWHEYVCAAEVRFLKGRITFVGAKGRAPFPSAILIYRPVESHAGRALHVPARRMRAHAPPLWPSSYVSR
jgi:phage N-6-adenine-methyltransferase